MKGESIGEVAQNTTRVGDSFPAGAGAERIFLKKTGCRLQSSKTVRHTNEEPSLIHHFIQNSILIIRAKFPFATALSIL